MSQQDPNELRARLGAAQLMLIFSPEVCGERDPLALLEELAPVVDIVQVRPKPLARRASPVVAADPSAEARSTYDWAVAALDLFLGIDEPPLLLVNDRVDVALALRERGCAGVHLGQGDLPARAARELLGQGPLIGLSTHDLGQVVQAGEEPVDYLGLGPIFPSSTKGYARGLGSEVSWIAASGCELPIFAIGGVQPSNAAELERLGRAAVSSALLSASDPLAQARALRAALGGFALD